MYNEDIVPYFHNLFHFVFLPSQIATASLQCSSIVLAFLNSICILVSITEKAVAICIMAAGQYMGVGLLSHGHWTGE